MICGLLVQAATDVRLSWVVAIETVLLVSTNLPALHLAVEMMLLGGLPPNREATMVPVFPPGPHPGPLARLENALLPIAAGTACAQLEIPLALGGGGLWARSEEH